MFTTPDIEGTASQLFKRNPLRRENKIAACKGLQLGLPNVLNQCMDVIVGANCNDSKLLNMDLDEGLSNECGSEEGGEGDEEVATCHPSQVKQGIWYL